MRLAILHVLLCTTIQANEDEAPKKPKKYTEKEVKEMIKRLALQITT